MSACPYSVNFPLGYSSNSGIEVQVLLSGQKVIQSVHLRAIADVYALLPAVHDVNHTPAWTRETRSENSPSRHIQSAHRGQR